MKVIPIKVEAGITGFESPAAEYLELGLSLDELLIQHPTATFIGVASGESMIGSGVFDGDLLIVDRALEPSQGDLIVANYNGTFTCKILDMRRGLLVSSSPSFAPVIIRELDSFQLEGVVSRSIRLHRKSKEVF
ncbi:S24 family peptidase [Pseudoalteromonas spongiae]|uniref:S24 family peptidase n=1 Tax=Pseudoalteromonas spongiae TaxID=298657 RepID=A0ABU8ESG2_9GAMM